MTDRIYETIELPACWASALFNSDDSGLDPDDIAALNRFTESMLEDYTCCHAVDIIDEEPYFATSTGFEWYQNEIRGGDVVNINFDLGKRK